jgi:glycosyltransferase involved in cell wall biosynthesis
VHHLLGSEHYLHRLVRELDVPFDFTVHDYYALAPQPHLVDRNGRFVGEDLERAERELLAARIAPVPVGSLAEWQNRNRWLVTEASRFIVPSMDAWRRFSAHFPDLRPVLAAHPGGNRESQVVPTEYRPGSRLRIGLLGGIGAHKGLSALIDCARLALLQRLPLEFVMIGEPSLVWRRTLDQLGVQISGRYQAGDLPRLVAEYAPHLLWFPAQCPETFSYTLSEALRLKLPLVVSDLGALAERIGGRPWTWVRPWDAPPQAWLSFFLEIQERHFALGAPPAPIGVPWTLTDRFYRDEYLGWIDRAERQTASYVP